MGATASASRGLAPKIDRRGESAPAELSGHRDTATKTARRLIRRREVLRGGEGVEAFLLAGENRERGFAEGRKRTSECLHVKGQEGREELGAWGGGKGAGVLVSAILRCAHVTCGTRWESGKLQPTPHKRTRNRASSRYAGKGELLTTAPTTPRS
jgi:hypothetical protein